MRKIGLWLTAAFAATAALAGPGTSIPFVFERNTGQVDRQVRYFGRTGEAELWLLDSGAVFSIERKNQRAVVRMNLKGARPHPKVEGMQLLPGKTNYFNGSDPALWRQDIAQYGAIRYRELYPGIDLLFHASGPTIEYDWIVSPGANPGQISVSFEGADETRIESSGDLVLTIGDAEVRQKRPHVYQEGREVEGHFMLHGRTVGFEMARYDHSRPLTIDPVLTYATHLGGSGSTSDQSGDNANAVTVDSQGNVIVAGTSFSTDFPAKTGLYTSEKAVVNGFIAKVNPSASGPASLIWSTYLGGSVATQALGVALDPQNNVYVTGYTYAPDFPLANAFQKAPAALCPPTLCQQAFVTKISSGGNQLIYSSYLGGANNSNQGNAIAVTSAGNAWVTGYTQASDFPTSSGAAQASSLGGSDGFVSMVSLDGSQLVYSSYLGGSSTDSLTAIAVDGAGNAYVTGSTNSVNYPRVNAYQASLPTSGQRAGVVTEINPNAASPVVYSTYLGGGTFGQIMYAIALDGKGNIYVGGRTASATYPTTANAIQNAGTFVKLGNGLGAVISELNPSAQPSSQLVYSTYLTGGNFDEIYGIAVDGSGRIIVAGNTQSPSFPTTPDAFQSIYAGNVTKGVSTNKAFLAIVDPTTAGMPGLVYSTLYGGSLGDTLFDMAVNAKATTAVLVGAAVSPDLFVTSGAYQSKLSSTYGDAFIASFSLTQLGPVVGAMTNAASFVAGNTTFAPGEIVTLFPPANANLPAGTALGPPTLVGAQLDATGHLANTLAGCQFLVNGVPAPLVYVLAGQVSAILPYELTPNIGVNQISYGQMVCNNAAGNVFQFSVVAADPGVFAAVGGTQGAILNQDGSYNSASNPAAAGSIVTIFATGEGVLTPAGQDGRIENGPINTIPTPTLPVSVLFGTTASPMLTYAAVAPAEVDGLLQIDAQVPTGLTPGNVPITVTIGKFSSQKGLSIAVK